MQMMECRTDREEQTAIIELILEQQSAGVRLADVAVLFRTNEQGRVIERALVSMSSSELATQACMLLH